jgi:site-specific recombinase XerD
MNDIKEIKHQERVYIYYSKNREILRYATGVKWSERNKNNEVISSILSKMQSIVKDYVLKRNGEEPSVDYVKNKMKEKQLGKANIFYENIDLFIAEKSEKIKKQSVKDFISFQHSISDYETDRNKKLTFDDITIKFINDYVDFLVSTKRKKDAITRGGLNDNTVSKRLDVLKSYMKWIEEYEIYEFPLKVKNYKPIQKFQIKIVHLSLDELRSLQKLKLTGKYKKVRDIFLFGAMTSLRYSDIVSLTEDDIQEIDGEYRMVKTAIKSRQGKEQYVQTLNDTAVKIWNEYEHNLNHYSNQKFNLYLKEFCRDSELFNEEITVPSFKGGVKVVVKIPKWQMISSHTGRRSFITNTISEGITIKEIMEMTSHTKIDTLIMYINKTGSNKETTNKIRL